MSATPSVEFRWKIFRHQSFGHFFMSKEAFLSTPAVKDLLLFCYPGFRSCSKVYLNDTLGGWGSVTSVIATSLLLD